MECLELGGTHSECAHAANDARQACFDTCDR
jgi:hypothetical protein